MGLLETFKALLSGGGLDSVLESTGLGEHVDGFLGEGSALAENFGLDVGPATEALGLDGVTDLLADDPGDVTAP